MREMTINEDGTFVNTTRLTKVCWHNYVGYTHRLPHEKNDMLTFFLNPSTPETLRALKEWMLTLNPDTIKQRSFDTAAFPPPRGLHWGMNLTQGGYTLQDVAEEEA